MSPITVPYHLLIPTVASIAVLLLILVRRERLLRTQSKKSYWVSLVIFLATYALIVGGATFYDIYYQWDLNRYDLDGDGFFGANEVTPAQEAALRKLTNDMGRNLSMITGLVFSAMVAIAAYMVGMIRSKAV
ncbi:hypothetical protein [Pontibacter ramchanderi]|uniref:Uncharacterized protein n=1 Tax=Pontibacter ramchanderi TaxID=1179743 RepID=A0A2N3UC81_9BACT|nr:hypothetical protein [Pontibacter ramchanderi]PKV67000.1 hypothetical protein BD749_2139 [Pontibacter ramchanderi]